MLRQIFHSLITLALILFFMVTAQAEKPNIVIILSDDQGWGDLSLNGNTNLSTPNIDSIAHEGAMFERFYVSSVCAPTRAEMLTGRYHARTGVNGVSRGEERMNPEETTLAEVLNKAGYATGIFGKWHNGTQHPYHPNSQGFDEFYGFASGHWGNYFDPVLEHNGELVRGKGFIVDDLTSHALEFIDNQKDEPFLCYLAYNTPHSPFQVPDKFYDKFKGADISMRHRDPEKEDVDTTRAALAMCENIDWNVGRVLEKLDELNLDDNTIVIYFSDNGPNSWRWNGDMRGRKGSTDEGGVRVPFLVKWPGHIEAGAKVKEIAGAIDLLPTLAGLLDLEMPQEKPIDGVNLSPLLLGKAEEWQERLIYSRTWNFVSVRNQRFHFDSRGDLYDLDADPGQRSKVNDKYPEVANTLSEAVKAWREEVLPDSIEETRPFAIGYGDWKNSVLPARDGVNEGSIKRSGGAPNCSYFTNWTLLEDRMTWNVEVAQAGTYEVTAYYTCPEKDVGATVRLSLGDAEVKANVLEANDPPAYGMEQDRVPRGSESYVKDFKPMSLGNIELQAGQGTLVLDATEMPGDSVMEVRALVFTRL